MNLCKFLVAFIRYYNIITIFNRCSIHHRIIFSFNYSKTLNNLTTNIDVENLFCIDFSNIWQKIYVKFQELFTIQEHLRSHPVFSGVRVTRCLVFCVLFCRSLFVIMSFFFWQLSVLLPFFPSDYPLVSSNLSSFFINISVIFWQLVLLSGETIVHRENHW